MYANKVDSFVNSNKPNVESVSSEFAKRVDHDSVDADTAYPVYLYFKDGELVAWYDSELYQGYISQLNTKF